MLRIIHSERRGAGWATANLCYLTYPHGTLVAALQRHALARHPWQGRLYLCINRQCELLWESPLSDPAQIALDALLETLAPYGLSVDLYPLVNALLPEGVGQPETAPAQRS